MFVYQQTVESEATAESLYVKTRRHSLFQHESRAGAASLDRALLENAVVSPRPARRRPTSSGVPR